MVITAKQDVNCIVCNLKSYSSILSFQVFHVFFEPALSYCLFLLQGVRAFAHSPCENDVFVIYNILRVMF